jgi:signal transduction histidine kinase
MKNPPLDELKFQALPEVAAALRAAHEAVLDRWHASVVQVLPSADELTMKQLRNSVPELLEKIATALEADYPAPTQELIALSPTHGSVRFHQHFNLNELMIEYHLLRRAIIEQLCEQLGRDLLREEIVAVNTGVDVALRQATVAYAEHQAAALKMEANALTTYLSFLSHDIRGGLNGALLMIEVLKRELNGDEKYATSVDDLDTMRRSMLDTVATMDRFLHAERLRRGKMPVKIAPVKVRQLLEESARSMSYQVQQRKLQLEIDAPAAAVIETDRELLAMILQNLLSNAIKYSSAGTIRLSCSEHNVRACGRITVADQGPGIPPERLASLFTAFTRGETHGQPGIGLGLSIARHAADLIGARLWADSKLGEGTRFHIDLA